MAGPGGYTHGVSVAGCLPRYMSGGPISDKRLCSVSDDAIVFRYRDHRDGTEKRMRISPHDFLARWFEHVPPRGLRMIRRSGVYANCSGKVRKSICEQLAKETASTDAAEQSAVMPLDREMCPLCNTSVAVRYVCRFVAGAVFEGLRLDAALVPYTRPP